MSREALSKALVDSGMTIEWCLEQVKKVGEDKGNNALRMKVVDKVMNWHDLVDKEGFTLPAKNPNQISSEQDVEDAEFKEETSPKLID